MNVCTNSTCIDFNVVGLTTRSGRDNTLHHYTYSEYTSHNNVEHIHICTVWHDTVLIHHDTFQYVITHKCAMMCSVILRVPYTCKYVI